MLSQTPFSFEPRLAMASALTAVLAAVAPPCAAFGVVGGISDCPTPQSCTAAIASQASYLGQYNFTAVTPGYSFTPGFGPGVTWIGDGTAVVGTGVAISFIPPPSSTSVGTSSFVPDAHARAQSDFGVNRAQASASTGVGGTHTSGAGTARLDFSLSAVGTSAWRDVWSFSAAGQFNAVVAIDGSLTSTGIGIVANMPVNQPLQAGQGFVNYRFQVWDVTHYSADVEGTYGPTLVLEASFERSSLFASGLFAANLPIGFAYEPATSYVVTTELNAHGFNGGIADVFQTARLQGVQLSGGQLTALSGHNYVTAVPEPASTALWLVGLMGVGLGAGLRARRRDPQR